MLDLVNSIYITFTVSCYDSSCSGTEYTPYDPSLSFTNGIVKIQSIDFYSSGTFTLKAEVSGWTSASCNTGIMTTSIDYLTIVFPSTAVTYKIFSATIYLYGEDGLPFKLSESVTITNSDNTKLSGTRTKANNAGTVTFDDLYFSGSGTFTWSLSGTTYSLPSPGYTISITVSKSTIALVFSSTVNFT